MDSIVGGLKLTVSYKELYLSIISMSPRM